MSTPNQPWRKSTEEANLLDTEAAAQWNDLLGQTQRGVADLRDMGAMIDTKIQQGEACVAAMNEQGAGLEMGRRMAKMESRLALLERAVGQLAAHMPVKKAVEKEQERMEPFEHLLGSIRMDAA